ncbi:MAG: glutamate--tRNA ligase [Helicobacteraceae bacterium]|nr:glutamate--tRNA ligase [Helicobacteraceae bacterium]
MLRFAPSPTGDMHIGNLRVAIFNYLVSLQRDEPLTIRIEDTDKERNIEGKDKEILDILGLFGIEYINVTHQSENLKHHRAMTLQLLQEKKAFNCFCTSAVLDQKREASIEAKKPFRYDDSCTNLPAELTIDNMNPFTVRIKKPQSDTEVIDLIKGNITFKADDVDSFIIMRQDKYPTYNFACAVDDMISDISLVIRGEDHVSNTPKQMLVRSALGYNKKVEYAHLPIILNNDGKKMSKRDDASSVKWLLEEGFIPSAIINYLILIGNKVPNEIFTMNEAKEWFDLTKISRAPAKFDMTKLRFINHEHLKMMDSKELSRFVGFADEEIGELAKLFLEEASTLKELRQKIGAVFASKDVADEYKEGVAKLSEVIKNAPFFSEYDEFKKHIMSESGLKGKNLFKPLRIVLSGSENGPDLSALYGHIKNYLGEIVK